MASSVTVAPPPRQTATVDSPAMEKDRAYIHRVLNGEKPCTLAFMTALPLDVKKQFARLTAEHYHFIVVQPSHPEHAAAAFAAGLFGLMRLQMVKADLREREPEMKTVA